MHNMLVRLNSSEPATIGFNPTKPLLEGNNIAFIVLIVNLMKH